MRYAVGGAGVLVGLYGAYLLLELGLSNLVAAVVWLAGGVIVQYWRSPEALERLAKLGKIDEASAEKAKKRISAADVTSRPVRPIPVMTAREVSPVRSYSSRIRAMMKTS